MKKENKELDAVKLMREIRDEMSCEIEGMSYEEQKPVSEQSAACNVCK